MRILVTGGAGFIGSHIADALIEAGQEVVIIDDFSTGSRENLNPKATFIEISITDPAIAKVFEEHKPEVVIHHAAQIDVRKSVADPVADANINIGGSLNVLENAQLHGVKKFIFASSGGAIYGETDQRPTPETFWPAPISPYGIAKWTVEHYLYYYHTEFGIPYVALRYANVYGPRQNSKGEAGVVAIFADRLLKNRDITINGTGEQTRDFVFVGDVVAANLKALDSDFIGAVNIGTSVETSVNQLAELMKQASGSSASVNHVPAKPGEQMTSCVAIELARQRLGWIPAVGLDDGLRLTVEWFRQRVGSP